ncbi:DUF1697 domain-containing protein [Salana multivorans]
MTRYAILMRGINVGKARRIGMADLRELLTAEGYRNVATLLQSGNVALDTDQTPEELGPALEKAIEARFGFAVDVILRTRDELAHVVATNPLRDVAADGSKYVVTFLAEQPTSPVDAALEGVDLGEDQYAVDGAEMYIWCPHGLLNSPLMTALGKAKGGPSATTRNWNTVEKLHAMMG